MLSFVWWRFVWNSQRLLCRSKCPVNWPTKKTSRLWLWISLPHRSASVPAPSSFSSFSVPAPSLSSAIVSRVPVPSSFSSFSFPAPSLSSAIVPVYQRSSVSSVPAPSVSLGAYSVNLAVPEGIDTEKVTDKSVTVITEQTFHVDDQAVSGLCACKSCVTGRANGEKNSGGL